MKNLIKAIGIGCIGAFTLVSCMKGGEPYDANAQLEREKPVIRDYVNNSFPGMKFAGENTGIWYEIVEQGDGEVYYEYKMVDTIIGGVETKALRPPTVTVNYVGKIIPSGAEFESYNTKEGWAMNLNTAIPAWQIAFYPTKIDEKEIGGITEHGLQKGMVVRIATPSYWAYRDTRLGDLPPNTPLFFEITVLDIE